MNNFEKSTSNSTETANPTKKDGKKWRKILTTALAVATAIIAALDKQKKDGFT